MEQIILQEGKGNSDCFPNFSLEKKLLPFFREMC